MIPDDDVGRALPSFAQLPIRQGLPADSSWGVFGDEDELGTLNLLTAGRVVHASTLVRKGAVFRLDQPIGYAAPPLFERAPVRHTRISRRPFRNDDQLDNFNTQEGSQWDGLAHVGLPDLERYYNGVRAEEIGPDSVQKRLGIHRWANRFVGRGLLLDVCSFREEEGNPVDPLAAEEYTLGDLDSALRRQGCAITPGTILLVRTGWLAAYLRAAPDVKEAMASREKLTSCGLEPTREVAAWLWDNRIAAIAFDCPAAETWPWDMERGPLHYRTLGLLGLPLGEQFNLEELAEDSRGDGVWEGMLVSTPLYLMGGIASPPNAVFIK